MAADPHPFVDPELAASMPSQLREPLTMANLASRRAVMMELLGLDDPGVPRNDLCTLEDARVAERDGSPDLRVLILRPSRGGGPWPCVYHIHGGGLVMGDRRVGLDTMLGWMEAIDLVVVSVEYRLAPEHPHPAPVEDCYAGLDWTARNADDLGIDPARLVIAGASAGGGLAAATALLARDRGGPVLAHQILMCPMLDDRVETQSSSECDGTGSWGRASNIAAWEALLGANRGGLDVSPYAAPSRATDLRGLPPAFIDVGTAEIFRDETIDYATRLLRDGVPVELHVWPGGVHGFDVHVPNARLSRACREARLSYLRRTLA
jgi:acetyl esterase/lipase